MELFKARPLGDLHSERAPDSSRKSQGKTVSIHTVPLSSREPLPLLRPWDTFNYDGAGVTAESEGECDSICCPSLNDSSIEPTECSWGYLNSCWWNRAPPEILRGLEKKFYENNRVAVSEGFCVQFPGDFFKVRDKPCRIWTRWFKCRDEKPKSSVPIVLIHGMAAGGAIFAMNVTGLSQHFNVFVIDLPGFARSSRNEFADSADDCEDQFVESIDRWRRILGIKKMNLIGHSFGGYICTLYSMKHPENVRNLILADPWGFNQMPKDKYETRTHPWLSRLFFSFYVHCYPLALARMMGRLSFCFFTFYRKDLNENMKPLFPDPERNITVDYLLHSNMHRPTGEAAFFKIMSFFAWAKKPLLPRLHELHPSIPLIAIYGLESWVSNISCEDFVKARNGEAECVCILIDNAHHHVYAQFQEFNKVVIEICKAHK